jgi:NAD(P)-dependent dehydrogenase (short-subunit alcohol dehydrogenase family)
VPEQLLADRVALVTGAAHPEGIGRAICAALAEAGATVVGVDLAGAEGLAEIGGLACDVTDMDQVNTLVDKVLTNHGAIDVLVNNAGVGVGSADFLQITDEDWDLSLAVNLKGVANLCRAVIPNMLGRGGSIINVASLAGTGAMQSIPACYTASKFAAVGLTKQLAAQYAPHSIRVNALCPGSVVTQMHQQSLALLAETNGISIEEAQALEDSHIPLGRSAQPREVGQAAVFLASDMGSYVTGVALPVAGGMAPGL